MTHASLSSRLVQPRGLLAVALGVLVLAAAVVLGYLYIPSRTTKTSKTVPSATRPNDAEKLLQQLTKQKNQGSAKAGRGTWQPIAGHTV